MRKIAQGTTNRLRRQVTKMATGIFAWVRATRKRRIITTIIITFAALSTIFDLFVAPRMYESYLRQYPQLFAIQQALEKQFPDMQIHIGEQTFYDVGNDKDGKQHILAIGILGNSLLNYDEAMYVQDTVCKQLAGDTSKYDSIYLQSVNEKRIWLFFSRTKHSGSLSCDPAVQAMQRQAAPTKPEPVVEDSPATSPIEWTCCQLLSDPAVGDPSVPIVPRHEPVQE